MKLFYLSILIVFSLINSSAQNISDFESFGLDLDTFSNGADGSKGFREAGHFYNTKYDNGFWLGGWALSTMRDTNVTDFTNLYSSITASGNNSNTYAIGQNNSRIAVAPFNKLKSIFVTNTTYAYNSMLKGDQFAKKFGGESGKDPDFFLLTIYPYLNGSVDSSRSVEFYLADFRFEDSKLDYIVNTWTKVDLSDLGDKEIDSIEFVLTSSDVGQWGINTPAFYAIDDFESEELTNTERNIDDFVISIAPNPTSDYITVYNVSDYQLEGMKWEVLSLNGERLLSGDVSDGNMMIMLDELQAASYMFRLWNSQIVKSYIVVKQ